MAEEKWDNNELKSYAEALRGKKIPCDIEAIDKLYAFASAAQSGEIEADGEWIDEAFRSVLFSAFRLMSAEEALDWYPLAKPCLPALAKELPAEPLYGLAEYYKELGDNENYFLYSKYGIDHWPEGVYGGSGLVEQVVYADLCLLNLARCYSDGIGTEKNYPVAMMNYREYRTDPLAVKHEEDQLTEEELADLFEKMKAESEAGENYPGLHYALALMAGEGFGTPYDPEAYEAYYAKEMENYRDGANAGSPYREWLENHHNDWSKKKQFRNIKEWDDADLAVGDVVRMGKYNHRDVLWHVLRLEDGCALLLSAEVLDSSYEAHENYDGELFGLIDNSNYQNSAMRHAIQGEWLDLKSAGYPPLALRFYDYFFLLPKEEIEKCGLSDDVLIAFPREQALVNGYSGDGVMADEETGTAPWWTSADGEEEGTLLYVDAGGALREGPAIWHSIGLRPAVWLEVKKKAKAV